MNGNTVRGFDFHCHVDLFPDPAATIAACEAARIVTLAVTTTPKAWSQNRKWTTGKRYVHSALGLHPELVAERHGEIVLLEHLMAETNFIGEIGLDGSPPHSTSLPAQRDVFTRTIRQADRLGGRVLSIHSRRAAKDVIECLRANSSADRVLPILHWFSGSAAIAQHAVHAGCYFSVNHRMLESAAGLTLVRSIPADRILTETDAPFTVIENRKSEPGDVLAIASRLAVALGVATNDMEAHLRANASRVLEFAGVSLERGNDD
jgi:TatD DNase family protein